MKDQFYPDGRFHFFNKSIQRYKIFRNEVDKKRFLEVFEFCNNIYQKTSFSTYSKNNESYVPKGVMARNKYQIVKVIAYCIMPDHYHFLVKSEYDRKAAYKFINRVESSYTLYYNRKYKRKGPLWQNDYRCVEIESESHLFYVSMYVHLNPTTALLVEKPEDWKCSSYNYFIRRNSIKNIPELFITHVKRYRQYINDNIQYQRNLKKIKKFLLE